MAPLLTGVDLHKAFGRTRALRGAGLTVAAGEIVAVIGPSGSGKSTLLRCLAAIIAPDAGEVRLDGRRIDDLPDRTRTGLRRSEFGFVFPFGQLVPELPAAENVALPLLLAGAPRRRSLAAARDWLTRLGLPDAADRRPADLSGGEAQRVALARALIARPRVVFADEPTGALDSVAADQVMDLLVDAARAQRTGVVLVTHEPRVSAYADRTVLVRDGAA
ncbi:ABC transporter ATP-binding protein [Actinoplanes solisilvae]|uniref:ABC transporter ATP-binding protein n=1 Tax=Actinoplanes solisilvae TaxID=2486853 RepID=UPI000FD98654|nr:ABC transporter ATP-binding protein [Actinoplanes solisilvae]